MKQILFFLGGVIVGMLLSFFLAYASGTILEGLGITLYESESESEQQRNFNIFVALSLAVSLVCGWISVKFAASKTTSDK